jgi:hypothetical protein
MFKIPTATIITLSGLLAAGLLLIVLTGENVSSSMDIMSTIVIPQLSNGMPTVPAVPSVLSVLENKSTATPTPEVTKLPEVSATPPAQISQPETIPGLVRVTEVPSPTVVPTSYDGGENVTGAVDLMPAIIQDAGIVEVSDSGTVENSLPVGGLVLVLVAFVGMIFVVFGVFKMVKRGK